jgi:hypothetical protein
MELVAMAETDAPQLGTRFALAELAAVLSWHDNDAKDERIET